MQSRWVDRDAKATVDRYAKAGLAPDLALRVYTTRLLGGDPKLVLHGGGNTSVKLRVSDPLGGEADVMYVKGTGADMASIEPTGMPAVRLKPLQALRSREELSDDDMARAQRGVLLDPLGPTPSLEFLLHAFVPHKFVDHTHATAVLSLIDQPDGEKLANEVYDGQMGYVPYLMPGFGLAKKAGEVFDKNPKVFGLILAKHGLFTFGADARESYERMIEMVTRAEERLKKNRKAVFAQALPQRHTPEGREIAQVASIVRGACALKDAYGEGAHQRFVLDFRESNAIRDFVNGSELARYSQQGVITPDMTIRTKNYPLIVPRPQLDKPDQFKTAVHAAVEKYKAEYRAYFERNNKRAGGTKVMLDPAPRVVLVPGFGLFGLGRSRKEALIAADMAEETIACITDAEAIGRFESISEADMFDCEYWPIEQAKVGATRELPLAGQIVAITGANGAIGSATARRFAAAGATLVLLDLELPDPQEALKTFGHEVLALYCDVTNNASVNEAFERLAAWFGGVDIVVSNAGAAWQGRIGEVDEAILRKSFELNFFGHQRVAQAAVKIMLAQGTGGCLLFNVSKQAVNPGPNFGPYGLPKAATLFLVRQYAVDYGADGIRANAVNADRIRSGLLTDDFIKERSKARGVSEKEYMSGNLLGREVTADDVAQAFLHQALELKTTGDVTTVDGGNIAAALR